MIAENQVRVAFKIFVGLFALRYDMSERSLEGFTCRQDQSQGLRVEQADKTQIAPELSIPPKVVDRHVRCLSGRQEHAYGSGTSELRVAEREGFEPSVEVLAPTTV